MLKPLDERLRALSRMKEISDLLKSLRDNLPDYPANDYVINSLLEERNFLMKEFIHAVPAYP